MDKVASLRAFVKVVESGSFAEAGRQLRLSRSAISKYIADLEESLGAQLLNRTTRHASPTENGQRYFERAVVILSEIEAADQAVAQAQSAPRGLLRVNAPMSFGTIRLGPVLADFMTRYPELQLQVVLSDDLLDPVQDGFDVTLRSAELDSSSLIARKIMPVARMICASPDYLARPGTPVDAQDITTRSRSQVEIDLRGEEGQASALALIARADLLVVNKIDLAPHVEVDVAGMVADASGARDGAPVLALSKNLPETVIELKAWVHWLLARDRSGEHDPLDPGPMAPHFHADEGGMNMVHSHADEGGIDMVHSHADEGGMDMVHSHADDGTVHSH